MRNVLLLSALGALLGGPLAAQTTPEAPATAPAAPKAEKSPWLIFDQPLDTVPARRSNPLRVLTPHPGPARPAPASAAPQLPAGTADDRERATQGATYVPLDPDTYRLLDRYAIKLGPDAYHDPHTSVRPYTRAAAAHLGRRLQAAADSGAAPLSAADRFNAEYLLRDNWANAGQGAPASAAPVLRHFYRTPTDFYHVDSKDFTLRVNPVALLQAGRDSKITDGLRYVNTRGVQVEGTVDQRLGFYAFLTDNQQAVPGYVLTRVLRDTIVPHEGYFKPFKAAFIGPTSSQYDFFTARGYVTYAATKHINVQFGHDRNFIGNGYRSLILSDYSTPYFFLKLNTRVWKLNYQNLFAELTARKVPGLDVRYPKKYLALHHLSLDVTRDFNVGVFESVVAGSASNRFELQYLNPLIFYRAVEQQTGSADNAVLGLDFRWNVLHTAQLYGQVVLDEFKLSEIRAGNGWSGNKQAMQLGAKYVDVAGLRNLDLQVEVNYVRPYTYQHTSFYTAYTHYNQPLAHPMGANLTEVLGVLSYQPLPRLLLVGKALYTEQGLDFVEAATGRLQNYGGNPLTPYNTLATNADGSTRFYGYRVGDGNKSRLLHADFTATYQPRLNLFVDAKLIARDQKYTLTPAADYREVYASLALRWNIAQRLHEF